MGNLFQKIPTNSSHVLDKYLEYENPQIRLELIPGWKLQEIENFKPNSTLQLESLIFYGLGSCRYKKVKELPVIKPNQEKVVDFYLTLLRTYCLPEAKEYVNHLLHHNFLEIEGKKLIFPKDMALR
jgi:hypothetical protein